MKLVVILGHPHPGSFNHAIAEAACSRLRQAGHAVAFHDLYAEGFDPAITWDEVRQKPVTDPVLERHCEELKGADGLVFVHPNWWGMPPAVMKGYIDRVFRSGVAYEFKAGDSGEGVPIGLLHARTAVVINTSDTDPEREQAVMKDPLETLWANCILKYCGVQTVIRRNFSVVVTSTPQQRAAWLDEVRAVMETAFFHR